MTFTCPLSVNDLWAARNRDGGWGYGGGGSWTEPTVYALLVLAASGASPASSGRGLKWLLTSRRPDGGWSPRPSVELSTWTTALAVLLLAGEGRSEALDGGVRWLLKRTGRESSFVSRLRNFLLGVKEANDAGISGWPWYPDTAAWVAPTALTILALRKAQRWYPGTELQDRIGAGRKFLFSRTCLDGGWNHGSTRALGYETSSYPEMTGLALLALQGAPAEKLGKSVDTAFRHLRSCRSAEGVAWLRLGLLAQGVRELPPPAGTPRCSNLVEACLVTLAQAAAEGRNVFLG